MLIIIFEAYVTNLGKYNEGELLSEPLKFPAATEEVQAVLKRIGVEGLRYEEYFMAEYVSDIPGLAQSLGEYADIDELNHLAHLLSELNESELDIFSAAVSAGEHTASVGDLINLVHNIGCYDFYRGITDDETLGHIYVEDMEMLDVPEPILPYFDFEAYGRDARINENGRYINGGYMIRSGDSFEEIYHGKTDIPKKAGCSPFRLFRFGSRWRITRRPPGAVFHSYSRSSRKATGRKDNGTSGQSVPKCLTRKEAI